MALFTLDPLDADPVKNGASNIRTHKGYLNTLLGRFFSDTAGTVVANSVETIMVQDSAITDAKLAGLIPPTKLTWGAADVVLKTNTGATAAEYGKLLNANIDAAAAIALSKLAAGTVKSGVQTYMMRGDASTGAAEWFKAAAISGNNSIVADSWTSFTHALGAVPSFVRWVIVCTDALGDAGCALNNEVDLTTGQWAANGTTNHSRGTARSTSTVASFYWPNFTYFVNHPSTNTLTAITEAKWALKCYAFGI